MDQPVGMARLIPAPQRAEAVDLMVPATAEIVVEGHIGIDTASAAEILHLLRQADLPVASAWYNFEAAVHWLVLAVAYGYAEDGVTTGSRS